MDGQAPEFDANIAEYYRQAPEERRLEQGAFLLEALRTRELIERHAPAAPATVLDVGVQPEPTPSGWQRRAIPSTCSTRCRVLSPKRSGEAPRILGHLLPVESATRGPRIFAMRPLTSFSFLVRCTT